MARKLEDRIFVAAFDFGTTYSGYAFSSRDSPDKISMNNSWLAENRRLVSLKTPTCILLNPEGEFNSFGFEAEDKYATLAESKSHKGWYFFEKFKMKLYDSRMLSRSTLIEDKDRKTMPAMTIVAMSIRYLKNHMMKLINDRVKDFTEDDFNFVITIPAIWDDAAKQFMTEAAYEAGIQNNRLLLALEPEAASIFCQTVPTRKIAGGEYFTAAKSGTQYMIIDLGGGTVDITVHKKEGTKLKELHKATGGPWGGTSVDNNFLSFLEEIVGSNTMERLRKESMEDYFDLFREFEMKKRKILSSIPDEELVTLRVPVALKELYEEISGVNIEDTLQQTGIGQKMQWSSDKIRMHAGLAKSFFAESISKTVSTVKTILEKPDMKGTKLVLLVGGYAECELVQRAFREKFEPDVSIIIPEEAGLAILKGAVLFGHDPSLISSRILRYTYGCLLTPNFDPKIHPISKKDDSNDPPLCRDVFQIYVSAGTSVDDGFMVKGNYLPVTHSQNKIRNCIYSSTEKTPLFVTDNGCRKIGEYTVILPPYEGKERKFSETVTFRNTVIDFKSIEPNTGREFETTVDFLG